MRARRTVGVCLGATVLALGLMPGTARAEDVTFSFSGDLVWPGQVVSGRAQFDPAPDGTDDLDKGVWDVYLVFPNSPFLSDPRLLGQVKVAGRATEHIAIATVRFTVPQVRRGSYRVMVCNRPCADDSLGDLVGAPVEIVQDRTEARLIGLERSLTTRFYDRLEPLEASLESSASQNEAAIDRLEELADRLSVIEASVADLQRTRSESSVVSWLGGWAAAAGVAAFWGLSTAKRRRSRSSIDAEADQWKPPPIDLGEIS